MELEQLIEFYESLTIDSLPLFFVYYSHDAYFKDPFNEVRGVESIQHIFRHMFAQVQSPRFVITERVSDANGAVLGWKFTFQTGRSSRLATHEILGVSHLKFDALGKVHYHRDYWDAAEELYMKLPLIGILMRFLRRRLSAKS